ncbi:MAG: Ribosome-recycling factor [Candidatus Azambacteria bacterium GW2011_GWE2_46_45]|uniref:Ribosome-recycling factor n=1 Tax=Candidatus Azambacteria bacterium GW2011_GWE2_46_45 TaxID=1618625 RepID=A0A0G1Q5Y1_9BACT|nr:MAG: Ribosome-recycling factor [Candidatus Azambacteria bacterium GW2011_GWE2_46_45]
MFDVILKIKPELEKVVERFKNDLAGLRTGRATPALVENIMVDYYGSRVSLKEIAAISVPEPKQIVITPWDKNALGDMEKGIRNSDLGISLTGI